MSKKLSFLMVLVVLLPMGAGTPAYGGVLFSSDWDTALGTSVNAVSDGGVYSHVTTQEVGSGWVRIEVLGPDHPVLGGNNYIAVWLDNQKWGAVYEWGVWPTTAEDIYFRFYQRTYSQDTAPDYINFNSGHFVQPFQVYPPDNATSTNTWFGINGGGSTEWEAYISSVAHGDKWGYPYNRPTLDGLENDKWYRIEGHIHYFRGLEEDRTGYQGQTRCPTHTYFKIYDENGTLVKDTNDWMLGDPQDSQPDYTLQEWYDMGRYFWFEGNANSWYMGNNGPASASGAGRVVDYAAAEIRDDTWAGPVGGPQISSLSGTVAQGNTITISGSNMVDEDRTDWDVFFSNNPNASGFEGANPSADGYSAIGPSGGTYVTDAKVLGSQSIRFHVEGASSNCPIDNLMEYNAINPEGGDTGDLYYRLYARWNTVDDSWPTSHIKMIDCQGSGAQYYFQPGSGSVRPTQMNVAYDGASHMYAIPSGQLENDRWYAMEVRWKSTSPYAFQAWVDGTQIADDSPTTAGSLNYLLFGIINCCGTTSNFSLNHWMDGLAVSTSRIYPAAIAEIGDSSVYSTATKVYQAPISISDDSIQVKVDLTGLGSGPYYLWVTNNRQERSPSYEIQTTSATNPSPSNGATNVNINANLSWTAGTGATSHDVYFGTDSTPDSGEFQGNQTATTFEPGTMSNDTTYYWRIDEVDAQGTTTGNVWNFTTEAAPSPPGQASSPGPADSATDVSINADLSWTAGSGATSHDVYFGTTSPGTYQGNQTATTYDAGTMAESTTYYWRIDEINAVGTTTGNVWSFTTAAAAAGDVEIIGSWTSGTTHAEEAGTDRALIFIAHAESSADTSDLGSVTYGGQSMTKVVERNM
ncbi:MAG: fibronectin type III domain-containing protein [Planctomycetota bacterium]|jgi:hypothetical protein